MTDNQAKEKCVDVALATKMLYFAALPAAYDVACSSRVIRTTCPWCVR